MINSNRCASETNANEALNMVVDQKTVNAYEKIFEDMVGASEAYFDEAERLNSAERKLHADLSDPSKTKCKAKAAVLVLPVLLIDGCLASPLNRWANQIAVIQANGGGQ